jgi:hypothetical protein
MLSVRILLRTNRNAVGVLITAVIVIAIAAIVRGTSRSRHPPQLLRILFDKLHPDNRYRTTRPTCYGITRPARADTRDGVCRVRAAR